MNRSLLICLSCLGLAAFPGCMFSKKASKPKENPAIAAEMEAEFMRRWVEKRAADLATQGLKPDAAHAQAVAEFKVKYSYTTAAQK